MAKSIVGKGGNALLWVLLALLVFGLAGFGVQNFGGNLRSIGSVGDREISVTSYALALRQELAAFSAQVGQTVPFATAQALGIDRSVRAQVVTTAALDNEAARLGISVGDDRVRAALLAIPQFRGLDGNFDREAYRATLQQNGLTEAGFEAQVREETARTILQGTLLGGIRAPQATIDALFAYRAERRGFTSLRLEDAGLSNPVGEPDEATLAAWYAANPEPFTRPEAKRITYAWLTPAMIAPQIAVDEALLREAYDARIGEFVLPETRLVERLVFATDADAAAARARLDAGTATFEALVTERGLTLADADLGDVTVADLGEAGAAVFALTAPGIVGPLPSPLGPALFRMNGILAAQATSFADARATLAGEQTLDAARRRIADQTVDFDDRLAGGATLEQLAQETDMELGTLDYFQGTDAEIAAYTDFRTAADALTVDDFPQIVTLDDGGVAALRLDEVLPPTLLPLADVRSAAVAGWQAAEARRLVLARADSIRTALEAGESFQALGLAAIEVAPTPRDGFVEGAPPDLLTAVFAMQPGQVRIVEGPDAVHVVRLAAVLPADAATPEAEAARAEIAAQTAQSLAQDLFSLYARALEREAGITLNEAAINAVHAQLP